MRERGLSASAQNQALGALLFLYRVELGQRLGWMCTIVRAQRLPVCQSSCRARKWQRSLSRLYGPVWLMASLMYGAGFRLLECVTLCVKDLHLDRGEATIRDGKGGTDRVTVLPVTLRAPTSSSTRVRRAGGGEGCGASGRNRAPGDVSLAAALVRHAPLEARYDIRTIQELLGHRDVGTTMVYTLGMGSERGRPLIHSEAARRLQCYADRPIVPSRRNAFVVTAGRQLRIFAGRRPPC